MGNTFKHYDWLSVTPVYTRPSLAFRSGVDARRRSPQWLSSGTPLMDRV
ncbi:MAG: hypothetical protein LRS46_02355 [Desulfurococcales archaeon]|nr:hypothetical protein [Desulfurococcales archaeon]